jgi:hypothetical protein
MVTDIMGQNINKSKITTRINNTNESAVVPLPEVWELRTPEPPIFID